MLVKKRLITYERTSYSTTNVCNFKIYDLDQFITVVFISQLRATISVDLTQTPGVRIHYARNKLPPWTDPERCLKHYPRCVNKETNLVRDPKNHYEILEKNICPLLFAV